MLRTQEVVVFEESVGAKLVNNYQQLSTIAMIMGGQQLSTIIQNCRRTKLVNHYPQLTTIDGGQDRSTIINNYQQLQKEKVGQPLTTIINN